MTLTVNGIEISKEAIEHECGRIKQSQQIPEDAPLSDIEKVELQDRARTNLINRVLVDQEVDKSSFEVAEESIEERYQQLIKRIGNETQFLQQYGYKKKEIPLIKESIRRDICREMLFDEVLKDPEEIDEAALEVFYKDNPQLFKGKSEYKASHVVVHVDEKKTEEEALEKIKKAKERIENGDDFSVVADDNSDCPGKGGDLGWFPEGQMVEEFEKVVFKMKPGEVSDIFLSPFGYHIVLLEDVKEGDWKPFEEVKGNIRGELIARRDFETMEAYFSGLKKAATISG